MPKLSERMQKRLKRGVDASRDALDDFRVVRRELIEAFVGKNYGSGGGARAPINLLELAVGIYLQNIVANNPRVLVTPRRPGMDVQASDLELQTNHRIVSMGLQRELSRAAQEALFGIGTITVGRDMHGDVFAESVDLEDRIHDASATRREACQFVGHEYWERKEAVLDNDDFDQKARDEIDERRDDEREADKERAGNVEHDKRPTETLYDRVRLCQLYLPLDRLLVTATADVNHILQVREYEGPDAGPYFDLGFRDVPGCIMPLSLGAVLQDLNSVANMLYCKLMDDLGAMKQVMAYKRGAEQDATNLMTSKHGDTVGVDDPSNIQVKMFGGPDPTLFAASSQVRDLFTWIAGNLDLLGGLSPQSSTLGQDKLLAENASKRVAEMQHRMVAFTKAVVSALAWHDWHDGLLDNTVMQQFPGTGLRMPVQITSESFRGDFGAMDFEIDPYSMQEQTPGTQLQALSAFMQQIVMPLMPLAQQQGVTLNLEYLMRRSAKLLNLFDIEQLINFTLREPTETPGMQDTAGMPPNTTRRYERVNRPGATMAQKGAVLQSILMGARPQSAEGATLDRRVS